jgi:hypothetical protein
MSDFTAQLLLAISALSAVVAYLFRLLSQQWNDRLSYIEAELKRCQSVAERSADQTSRVADLAERRVVITREERD